MRSMPSCAPACWRWPATSCDASARRSRCASGWRRAQPPAPVDALLLSALALLLPRDGATPYADHTLVDQAVTAARQRTPAAVGFINAVLRRFVRERGTLLEAVMHQGVAAFNHPLWWIERVRQDWPASWRELLAADNQAPPMVLRVNARRGTRARLRAAPGRQWAARPRWWGRTRCGWPRHARWRSCPALPRAMCRCRTCRRSARRPLLLKSAAAAWRARARCLRRAGRQDGAPAGAGRSGCDRARRRRRAPAARATEPAAPAAAGHAARAPTRAPSTAGGTARRFTPCCSMRPAARRASCDAIPTCAGCAARRTWPRWRARKRNCSMRCGRPLRPGGVLLYVTCSIFRVEGQQQIDAFLQRHGDAGCVAGHRGAPGHVLPLPDNGPDRSAPAPVVGDGFFFALIRKPSS